MLDDLRLAFRALSKSPGFAALAIATLALGLGASTAIFSVVSGVLLKPLPYPQAERIVQVESVFASGFIGRVSYPSVVDLREQSSSFSDVAAYAAWTTSATMAGEGLRIAWAQANAELFAVTGATTAIGRVFTAEEERRGDKLAVVSYGFWESRLAGDRSLTDRTLRVGDAVYSIVGVLPRDHAFPESTEVWVPRTPAVESRSAQNWSVVARLRDGVTHARAQQDSSAIARRLKEQYGDDQSMVDVALRPVLDAVVDGVRPALLVALGAAGVLLLVACVNVANLLLARCLVRDRDTMVRLALGASPARLARGFLAESLLLSLAGAGLGILLALGGVPALLAVAPTLLPRAANIGVDWQVFAFALAAAVLVATLIGLVPAARAASRDMRQALADGHRVQGGSAAGRLRGALVVAQIALTLVLLVAAGLLGRSFVKLLDVETGYRMDGALIASLWLPETRLFEGAAEAAEVRNVAFVERLMERVRALPGVERVGGINFLPLEGGGPSGLFVVIDRLDEILTFEDFGRLMREPSRAGNAEFRVGSAEYFAAMNIPLVRGRLFDERDVRGAPHIAVISVALAEARWPGEDPLGKLVQFGNMDGDLTPFTVVGIVGDVQDYGIGTRARPTFYVDHRQRPRTAAELKIVIQGSMDVAATTAAVRRIATELDPGVPVAFKTLREVVTSSLADRRFMLLLLGIFGAFALVLATMGVYGVVAYMAARRTSEIGIRMALGAQSRDVERLLVRQGARFALAGVALGLLAAFAVTRLVAGFLYGVGATDPVTFAAAAVALLVAAIMASWIPAHRVSKIEAVVALRHE
jgi:putative ABC transport system permease protein